MLDHDDTGGVVAAVPRPFSPAERSLLRGQLRAELPRLRQLLETAANAADGPDPEASLVYLGMLTSRTAVILYPL